MEGEGRGAVRRAEVQAVKIVCTTAAQQKTSQIEAMGRERADWLFEDGGSTKTRAACKTERSSSSAVQQFSSDRRRCECALHRKLTPLGASRAITLL